MGCLMELELDTRGIIVYAKNHFIAWVLLFYDQELPFSSMTWEEILIFSSTQVHINPYLLTPHVRGVVCKGNGLVNELL